VAAALWARDRIVVRVCNDARLRACFAAFNDEGDVDRALSAVASIGRGALPPGTVTAEEWISYMRDGED
jgi:selenocysteine lyase/cysteine desulfurase